MSADFELKKRWVLAVFLAGGLMAAADSAVAQSGDTGGSNAGTSGSFECTNVNVDYANDPNLTREERIRLMDQALFQSLGQYDACEAERAAGAASGSEAGGGGAAADGNAGELGQSVASSDMSGDEAPNGESEGQGQTAAETANQQRTEQAKWSNPDAGDEALNSEYLDDDDAKKAQEQGGGDGGGVTHGNGKIPEDIPAADNDSVLEAQIRRAAINEADPKTKARLWNEYRKYKGLPTRVSAKSGGES